MLNNTKIYCESIPHDILTKVRRYFTKHWRSGSCFYRVPMDIYAGNFVFLSQYCMLNTDDQSVLLQDSMLPNKPNSVRLIKDFNKLVYWNKVSSLSADGEIIKALGCLRLTDNIAIDAVKLTLDIVNNKIIYIDGIEWVPSNNIKVVFSPLNRKSDIPHVLKVELTQYCNLECSYCTHQYKIKKSKLSSKQLFDYADKSIFEKLGKVSFTGLGESMLANNLWEVIEYFNKAQVVTSLVSNGMLLNRNIESILKLQLNSLAISLDSTNPDVFEKKKKYSSYETIVSGINNFVKARNEIGARTQLGVICPYDPQSPQEAIKVVEFCAFHELPIPKVYPLYDFSNNYISTEMLSNSFDAIKSSIRDNYGSVPTYLCREEQLIKHPIKDSTSCNEPNEIMVYRADQTFDVCHESIFRTDCENQATQLEADWNSSVFNSKRFYHALSLYPQDCNKCNVIKLMEAVK